MIIDGLLIHNILSHERRWQFAVRTLQPQIDIRFVLAATTYHSQRRSDRCFTYSLLDASQHLYVDHWLCCWLVHHFWVCVCATLRSRISCMSFAVFLTAWAVNTRHVIVPTAIAVSNR